MIKLRRGAYLRNVEYLTAVLLLTAVITSIASVSTYTVLAYTDPSNEGFGKVVGTSEITLLAVSRSGKKLTGATMELKVVVTKGDGRVFLAVEPIAELDLQTSAKLAALVATSAVGADFFSYDYFLMLMSNVEVVGGPSAGAAMAVAIAAALEGVKINKSIAVTGIILPDATIGPVGGLPEKVRAAGRAGVKLVLIPKGQLIVKDPATNETVNIAKLASRYGMKVVEVGDIYEALKVLGIKVMTTYRTPQSPSVSTRLPKSVTLVMKGWVESFNRTYPHLLSEVKSLMKSIAAGGNVPALVKNITKEAEHLYVVACREVNRGQYYAAASDMFGAVIDLDTARWILKLLTKNSSLEDLMHYVSAAVNSSKSKLEELEHRYLLSGSGIDVSKLSVLVEVSKRVYEAESLLRELRSEVTNTSLSNATVLASFVSKAIYTRWRGESALSWSQLIEAVPPSSGLVITHRAVDESATLLTYYSRASVSYIGVFLGRYRSFINDLIMEVSDAENYLGQDPLMSLAICMSALARVAATLNMMFSLNLTDKALMLRNEVIKALTSAKELGMVPLIAMTYLERGDSVIRVDPASAIYFYDLALTNTVWYMIMSKLLKPRHVVVTGTSSTPLPATNELLSYAVCVAAGAVIGAVLTYVVVAKRLRQRREGAVPTTSPQ